MEIIARPAGGGKTTELIMRSARDWLYIVTSTRDEAYRIAQQAKQAGVDIPFPLTIDEFLKKQYSPLLKGFLIDNADAILQSMSRIPIHAISLTADGDPTNKEE